MGMSSFHWRNDGAARKTTRAVVNQYFQLSSTVPGRSLEKHKESRSVRCSPATKHEGWLLIFPANPENRFFQFPLARKMGDFQEVISLSSPLPLILRQYPRCLSDFRKLARERATRERKSRISADLVSRFLFHAVSRILSRYCSRHKSKISPNFSRSVLLKMIGPRVGGNKSIGESLRIGEGYRNIGLTSFSKRYVQVDQVFF